MSSTYRRLVARGRAAAIPVVAAAAIMGGALGVASASAKRVGSTAGAAVSKKTLAQLKTFIADQQSAPAWVAPGPAVNAKKALKGKTIATFPISSYIDACNLKGQQGYLDAEAMALGAKVDALNSTPGGPQNWQANLQQAITDKASAVVMLCGEPASLLTTQLAALKAHHIPVVDGNYNQTGGSAAFPFTNISAESGVNTSGGVKTDLADALVNLKGKAAHILFLNSQSVAQYAGAKQGLKKAMSQWCKSCSIVKEEDFTTQQWGPPETPTITSDLQANPSINTVIVTFDGMSDSIESAVSSAAATHPGLKMYAWGGGLAEIKAVQNGGTFAGDSGPNEKWDAYNQLDQVIRLLAHKPAANVTKEIAPNMFFTKKNAAIFSVGGQGKAYSDKPFSNGAFVKDYLRLWGVIK